MKEQDWRWQGTHCLEEPVGSLGLGTSEWLQEVECFHVPDVPLASLAQHMGAGGHCNPRHVSKGGCEVVFSSVSSSTGLQPDAAFVHGLECGDNALERHSRVLAGERA